MLLRHRMTSQFPRLFLWHVVRHVRRRPLLALLNVLSVALGIAVYLAIQIANHSANRSFAAGIDLVAGKSHLEVRGEVDDALWPVLARQPGVRAVTGLVEGVVTLPDFPQEYLRVLGIDLFSSEPFRTFQLSSGGQRLDLEAWMGTGEGIAVTAEFARRTGVQPGDPLRVLVNGEIKTLRVLSLLDTRDSPGASQSRFAAMDIGWAQELFGKVGRVSSLQVLLDDPTRGAAVAEQLRTLLPPAATVAPPRQRSFQMQTMLSAFQLNLTALSMVSLLVGVFLIYNTIAASVTRRRVEIGILRSLGATRGEVRWLFLGEACLLGALGIVVGAFGGVALAQVLTGAVAKTISSLYLLLSIERSWLDPAQFVTAAVFGFAAVLVGAWVPAAEAARVDPIAALSLGAHAEQSVERAGRWVWLAVLLLAAASVAAWGALHGAPPAFAFGAAFLILAGFSLFAPGAVRGCGALAARWRVGVLWRLAADHLRRSLHRNAITVAALATAIAMLVGLTVMISSFRRSVDLWVRHGIVADLFIAPSSNETIGLNATVPPAALAWLRARPEVDSVDTFRELTVPLRVREEAVAPALLAVVQGRYRHNLSLRGGDEERVMARVFGSDCVVVSEPFARKHGVQAGDRVTLATPRGEVPFEIAGVYADYTRDQGVMLMSGETCARWWPALPGAQSLAVYLRPGADAEAVGEAFREQFSRAGEFAFYSNRALRERIFTIFDQTFAVTYILRTVAVIVAIVGIFLSVTTLVAEREREIGMLRAIGASRGQVQRLFMAESGMIGAVASGLGLAAGLVLAMTLTWVVNPAFFGWTIQLHLPWSALITTPLWIIPATVLAAWYPAWRGSRAPIAEAVREE
jgi:putative ABC transport system permease protein